MEEKPKCTSCKFFNRWVLAVFGESDEDAPICKRRVWEYLPDMPDTELADKLATASNCAHYIKRDGGNNVRI